MPDPQRCPRCGAEIPVNSPSGHCPKCLVGLGLDPVVDAPGALGRPAVIGGRILGDYELQQQIGCGGMGVVFRARQISLNRTVALKLISAGELASQALVQRFHLEAEAAAGLHHPNIVPIYETGEVNGQHFFSMELIEGVALDKKITKAGFAEPGEAGEAQPLSRDRQAVIARIVAKVARAVDYAHRHGVLHRDLKPGNILLDAQGEPHLTDFGLAKVVGQSSNVLTISGAILGTPNYMAPEQASGQTKRVTTAADIYSLGAILYRMLTGHPPFQADTPLETLRKVVEEEPRHPTTLVEMVDRDLATICMKCLEKEPSRRYDSALALAEDVERWLRREPILARPVGLLGRLCRWCRREPAMAAMGATVMLLALAFMVMLLSLLRQAEERRKQAEAARQQSEEAQRALAEAGRQLSQGILEDLDQLWDSPEKVSLRVPAERRALLAGQRPSHSPGPKPVRLTFGLYTHTRPRRMYEKFASVLTYLETNRTGDPFLLDLIIYKGYSNAVEALVGDAIDFWRPGPASYILARKLQPGIRLLAKELHDGIPETYGVIFTRAGSGIKKLEDLKKGGTFAFGDPESTFGCYLARICLLEAGIRARDLSNCCTHLLSHDAVVTAVARGEFAAGAANSNVVARAMANGANLIILQHMDSVSFPWVASAAAPTGAVATVRQSLLELKDTNILAALDRDLTGFMPARPEDYDELARKLESAAQFDEP